MNIPIGVKKAAVLCILRNDKSFLLLRRSKEPHLGKYIPIGGHIEPFETPQNAAIREIKEETSISVKKITLTGIMTETSPTKFNWINYIYTADVASMQPSTCDEGILEWVSQGRLDTIPTPETDKYIYDYISKSKFFVFDAVYDEKVNLIRLTDELSGSILFGS